LQACSPTTWQAAAYLLTDNDPVSAARGASVLEDRSIRPVVREHPS
jgi:hypothetical protein